MPVKIQIGNHNLVDFRPLMDRGFYIDLNCSIRDIIREYKNPKR